MPEFVERASEFLVDRVAPRLIGRRGRVPRHDMEALERQAREELEARIQRGRPAPEEWPDAPTPDAGSPAPEPASAPAVRPPVRVAAALRVVAVDMDLPTPTPTPASRPSPAPVSPTSN